MAGRQFFISMIYLQLITCANLKITYVSFSAQPWLLLLKDLEILLVHRSRFQLPEFSIIHEKSILLT